MVEKGSPKRAMLLCGRGGRRPVNTKGMWWYSENEGRPADEIRRLIPFSVGTEGQSGRLSDEEGRVVAERNKARSNSTSLQLNMGHPEN